MVSFQNQHSIKIKDSTIKIQIKGKDRDREMKYAGAKNNFLVKFSAENVTNAALKFVKVASISVQIAEY